MLLVCDVDILSGEVAKAILRKGGKGIAKECKTIGK